MSTSPRVIFVNRFYWPDEPATAQLLTDLAESLAASGLRVAIITSQPIRHKGLRHELRHGVEIIRVGGLRIGRRHALLKALDFLSFSFGALRKLSALLRPDDTLVVMTDPPLLGLPATRLARYRGASVVHWVQDIYPEIAMAVSNASFAKIFRASRDRAWRRADACVALGTDMAGFIQSRGVDPAHITISPNWAPAGLGPLPAEATATLRKTWGLEGKFVVMYAGNLGRVHDLEPLLDLATALAHEPAIVFVLVGDGAQKSRLQSAATERGLTNLRFQPAQPRERLGETLALGDLHLVTLRENCAQLVFPSKLYGIAAMGRPVLFIGPKLGELARTIAHHAFGHTCSRDEIASAAAVIQQLQTSPDVRVCLSRSALAFATENGDPAKAAATWLTLLNSLKSLASPNREPQI